MGHHRHLTFTDRLRIEAMLKAKYRIVDIAAAIGFDPSTVYNELKRGRYTHLNSDYTTEERYSPDIAEERYRANLRAKGPDLKIGKDRRLAEYIEYKIIHEHYSPEAVLGEIEAQGLQFDTKICKATLYSYIDKGIFLHLTNKNLPCKAQRRKHPRKVRPARVPRGESIEKRPDSVNERREFGHWEMDLVIGRKRTKPVLLVLTERLTRREIIIRLPNKTTASVVKALNRLERRYGDMFYKIFKTITVDNGSEFSDCAGMESSNRRKGTRTKFYYCHPFSSCERGSNENLNRMIRRFVPKGANIGRFTLDEIQQIEDWLNTYPRKIHNYKSAQDRFDECLSSLT